MDFFSSSGVTDRGGMGGKCPSWQLVCGLLFRNRPPKSASFALKLENCSL